MEPNPQREALLRALERAHAILDRISSIRSDSVTLAIRRDLESLCRDLEARLALSPADGDVSVRRRPAP